MHLLYKVTMKKLTLVLAGLSMLGAFSVDTYFPSFPALAEHFNVSMLDMQKTLSFYLLALAFMSLFHGALSDSFGRRKIVLVALTVYTVGSVGSLLAPSFEWLIVGRMLQGLTAGAGFIITQAIIRDMYKGHEAQKLMAKIMMLFALAPAIAPILGGYLHLWFGWHGVFLFLTLLGTTLFAFSYKLLPETLPKENRHDFHPLTLTSNYIKVLGNAQFRLLALSSALCFGALCVYVTTAPDFVLNILGLKETQFGWLFIPVVIGLMTGSFISHRTAEFVSPGKLLRYAYCIMFVATASNVLYNLFFDAEVPWAVLPLSLYMIGSAIATPVITIKALDHFPLNRGLASSIMSFTTLVLFASVSAFVVPIVHGSALKLALFTFCMFALNCVSLWFAHRVKDEVGFIASDESVTHD